MRWWKLLSCLLLLWPTSAAAGDMDLALARLRVAAGTGGCERETGYCPDLALFERLVSELAIAAAPPILTPAHTSGVRGVWIGLVHTATSINAGSSYWRLGTRGNGSGEARGRKPDPLVHWTRLWVRKGLPFGLELGGQVGHGMHTTMWTLGGQVKLAILEGFQTGWGRLPDLSLTLSSQALFGAQDVSMAFQGLEITLSKHFVMDGVWRLSPLAAGQLLWIWAESGFVDLGDEQAAVSDASNVATFGSLSQFRLRWALGAELARDALRVLLSAMVEGPLQRLQYAQAGSSRTHVPLQLGLNASLAVEF